MIEMVQKIICDCQQIVYYQRISGRLQRIEGISNKKIIKKYNFSHVCHFYFILCLIVIPPCILLAYSIFPYPLPASCTVKWIIKEPCIHVIQRFRWQLLKESYHDCGSNGRRCSYFLNKSDSNVITATRISSVYKISNIIKILFEEGIDNSCIVIGKSESNEFSLFDYGENYCNLRNLINEANFVTDRYFKEITNNSVCTQVNMVVCQL